jgi:hypothetical protein
MLAEISRVTRLIAGAPIMRFELERAIQLPANSACPIDLPVAG